MTFLLAAVLALAAGGQAPAIARAQTVAAAITAGEFEKVESQFTDGMKKAIPPGRLAAVWTALETRNGALKSCVAKPEVVTHGVMERAIVACAFERAIVEVEFSFNPAGRIGGTGSPRVVAAPGVYEAPAYVDAATFVETSLKVGSGKWSLPAVLTRPVSAAPVPAIVLVHGSGPGDKDLGIGPNKPFKDLADGLASRGVAVLRYDKRSRVYGDKVADTPHYTAQDVVLDDVIEAVRVLRAQILLV